MTHKLTIALAAACAMMASPAAAQSLEALKINEVMVENQTSIVDEYGERHGWIELFNGNFAPLEISAVYLTNDSTNPTKYPVPLGDVNTRIARRQHVVFFTDGLPNRGTFHTNFVLTPGQDNWVGVYDAGGKLIDSVIVPASLGSDQTYARMTDGDESWHVRTGSDEEYITPSSANRIKDVNEKIGNFQRMDENGFGMTIMAMCIVFSALLLLCLCFYGIGKISAAMSRMNKLRAHHGDDAKEVDKKSVTHDSGEEIAAIVMALHEHLNTHDTESAVLTINKVKRAYSPWSSKIYGLRQVPEHRTSAK